MRKTVVLAAVCASVLSAGAVLAQPAYRPGPPRPAPPAEPYGDPVNADAYGQPGDEGPRDDSGWDAPEREGRWPASQLERLEAVLERYREIERRGGWKAVPTDLVMGAPYEYDCWRIRAVERRMITEGYLRHESAPPPRPPLPSEDSRRSRKPPPPPPPAKCKFTKQLTDAIAAFQKDRKVLGVGQLAAKTMKEMNRPVEEIVDFIEHDIRRWREVPLHTSGTYIVVSIPFFELQVFENGREELRMPVVVGQTTWQTPMFSDELEYIIVNPDWGIPETIAKAETWPLARRDPNYLRREGIVASGTSLRQKPGPNNPLGRIKFVMPNEHDVYLHDTPHKKAFDAAVRTLSHGCIRLGRPMDLAHYLLRDDPAWTPDRLAAAVATRNTQHINLREHVPVHIVYTTTRVTDDGRLEIRPDVYGKNKVRALREAPADESLQAWP